MASEGYYRRQAEIMRRLADVAAEKYRRDRLLERVNEYTLLAQTMHEGAEAPRKQVVPQQEQQQQNKS